MARTPAPSISRPSLEYFDFKGPHRVASGRLDRAGLRGVVYTPVFGRGLPVVAFGHGWMQPVSRYTETFKFLASWGIVVVAPDTARGPIASHGGLALDLRNALAIAAAGRLGGGRVRVDPAKAGVMGHSIGGGAAVLAAGADPDIKAVVTVTAAETRPSAISAGARIMTPSLHLVGGDDDMAGEDIDADGAKIAALWGGPTQLRTMKGVGHLGLPEGTHWTTALMGSSGVTAAQKATRTLAAAFFLRHLDGQDQLADELDGKIKGTKVEDPEEVRAAARKH
ncbi:alpha/beta hydrolase [Nakamurella sp. YIM 132087]|uniref:Alpha/beta hydrolase n=1 Tax=Nakamurella alba TaxID=2665158 RepID=A0A7K1FJV8_9ACTN|nr:alpha/beta hydrolase [Nakamurella alba]MTD14360.1 alpha/beta hydrolase [Nakamurella alba]